MTGIILIHPSVSFKNNAWGKEIVSDTPHLGLLILAATVEKIGLSVKIIDATDGSYSLQNILKIILEEHIMLIGITAMTMNIRCAVRIVKFLKQILRNEVKVSLG